MPPCSGFEIESGNVLLFSGGQGVGQGGGSQGRQATTVPLDLSGK